MTLGSTEHTDFYGYNAESYNPNTGLEYLRARYYNADKGRFFQEDTYLGDITDPLTLNRYAYTKNSPLNYVDPSGNTNVRTDMFGKSLTKILYDTIENAIFGDDGEVVLGGRTGIKITIKKAKDHGVNDICGEIDAKAVISTIIGFLVEETSYAGKFSQKEKARLSVNKFNEIMNKYITRIPHIYSSSEIFDNLIDLINKKTGFEDKLVSGYLDESSYYYGKYLADLWAQVVTYGVAGVELVAGSQSVSGAGSIIREVSNGAGKALEVVLSADLVMTVELAGVAGAVISGNEVSLSAAKGKAANNLEKSRDAAKGDSGSWERNLKDTSELNSSDFDKLTDKGTVKVNQAGSDRPPTSKPNSFLRTENGEHVFVYDNNGDLIYDISSSRVKGFKINTNPAGEKFLSPYKLDGPVPQFILDLYGW